MFAPDSLAAVAAGSVAQTSIAFAEPLEAEPPEEAEDAGEDPPEVAFAAAELRPVDEGALAFEEEPQPAMLSTARPAIASAKARLRPSVICTDPLSTSRAGARNAYLDRAVFGVLRA
jgi:hypothetical protein